MKQVYVQNLRSRLATIIGIFVVVALIVPSSSINAVQDHDQPVIHWYESVGDGGNSQIAKGFGNDHNVATRGMTIYQGELYVGTENHDISILDDSVLEGDLVSQDATVSSLNHQQVLLQGSTTKQSLNQNQGSSPKRGTAPLPLNSPLNPMTQPALIKEQQLGYQQIPQQRIVQGAEGYDPHYYFSPDGTHVYYLPEELAGTNGLPDELLNFFYKMLYNYGMPFLMSRVFHWGSLLSDGCEIWKYNSTTNRWTCVVGDESIYQMDSGFGYKHNFICGAMREFQGKLYVGTWSTPGLGNWPDGTPRVKRTGCEIYRFDGTSWEQVVGLDTFNTTGRLNNSGGFGNPDNLGINSMEKYNGYLYVGTTNVNYAEDGGCEIWRTHDGNIWEKVVDHGFRPFMSQEDLDNLTTNVYAWEMRNYSENLYVGTANGHAMMVPDSVNESLIPSGGPGYGCQLWKISDDGEHLQVTEVPLPNGTHPGYCDGFGERQNIGIRRMQISNGLLYVGVAATLDLPGVHGQQACEVWTYDGTTRLNGWHNIAGEEAYTEHGNNASYGDGFGNIHNKYPWSMAVVPNGASSGVWIGTSNDYGCQAVQWNGTGWTRRVNTSVGEEPDGFGDLHNIGLRSMIEYPQGTGIIVAGTACSFLNRPAAGCEIWMRNP